MRKYSIIVSVFSILASAFCIISLSATSFASVALLPLAFAAVFPMFFPLSYLNKNAHITIVLVYLLFFIRMVFLPVFGIIDGYFVLGSNTALNKYCNKAVLLAIYEFLAVTISLYLLTLSRKTTIVRSNLSLSGNRFIYILLVLVGAVLFFTVGRNMDLFEFGFKAVGGDFERSGDIEDRGIVHLLISAGILFLFLLVESFFSKKYNAHHHKQYVLYAIIIAMIMVSIITGERRTSQIYKGFACIWLLIGLYPLYTKRISRSLILVAAIVIAGMTLYKQYHAFLYDSYAEALGNASRVGMGTGTLDAYFYGVNTISKNLAFSDSGYVDFSNLLYDFVRNIFGVNFFVPRGIPLTSELYNLTLSSGESATGYLLSSVGYGYSYFGGLLAPVFSCLNVLILIILERLMRSTSSIEMSYVWAFLFMRFGFGFLGSFPPLLNLTTRNLFVNGGIVLVASFFNKSIKRVS